MSLDVYLTLEVIPLDLHEHIYIREAGQVKEISRTEWAARFPGVAPYILAAVARQTVYAANITHNLNKMADAAGLYQALWRPDEGGWTMAAELIPHLDSGLAKLQANPAHYRQFNPANGWGNYEGLVEFVAEYLAACRKYPQATIEVSR